MYKVGDRAIVVESNGVGNVAHHYKVGTEVEILDLNCDRDTIYCTDNDSRMPMRQFIPKRELKFVPKDAHVCPTCGRF